MVEEAYAGDIIGVFDPVFSIGDTIETSAKPFRYEGIDFCTGTFARVRQVDLMKENSLSRELPRLHRKVRSRFFRSIIPVWKRSLLA